MGRKCIWYVGFAITLLVSLQSWDTTHAKQEGNKDNFKVFDVTDYGVIGDGKPYYKDGESVNGRLMMAAWSEACENTEGQTKLLIPNGTYVVAQTNFYGHCKSHITIDLQGTIVPDPDVSQFPNSELITLQYVDNVTLSGPGKIDATVRGQPMSQDPDREIDFFGLLPLLKIYNSSNVVVDGINCTNPIAFYALVVLSRNITIQNVKFDADYKLVPESDTSGVYITASTQVTVSNSSIRTGDNCITIAPGSRQVSITGVTCSSGQGISIGQDPIDYDDLNVNNVTVKNCTLKETTNGVSLFPRTEDKRSTVSNIIFEELVMEKVKNPIVIHQRMHPRPKKSVQVKVRDVHIRNISGTTTSKNVVSMLCDPKQPCEGIEVVGLNLTYVGKGKGKSLLG